MPELQLREALRAAMTEEMERDETIFLMGEEVAEYNGAYKVSEGMLANRFQALDEDLDTLRQELGPAWSSTVVAVVTEFGRTAAVNGTRPPLTAPPSSKAAEAVP